jgi:hypothetical protein
MSPVTRRTTKLAVASVLAAVSLTGCAGLRPGVAAEVGNDTITTRELDDFAATFCTYNANSGQPLSSAEARTTSLTVLIRSDLAEALGEKYEADIDHKSVEDGVQGVAKTLKGVDADERDAFLAEVRRAIEGSQLVQQVVLSDMQSRGEQPTQETVVAASNKLIAKLAETEGVEIDPRFGTLKDVVVTAGSGSLSVPTEAKAKADAGAESGEDTSLPGAKTCG